MGSNKEISSRSPVLLIPLLQIAWIALVPLCLGILIVSIVPGFNYYFNLAQASDFRELGLSPTFVAAYQVTIQLVFGLVCLVFGALFLRFSTHQWVGSFMGLVGTAFALNTPLVYNLHTSTPTWHLPIALVIYFGQAAGITACCIFPDGKFVPGWTRFLAAALGGWMLVSWALPDAPFSPERLPPIILFLLVLIFGAAALYAQIYRYRRVSGNEQKKQVLWVALGLAIVVIGYSGDVMLPILVPALQQPGFWRVVHISTLGPAFRLLMLAGPLSIGIAILRHRAWIIDFVMNRALVFGAIIAGLLILYCLILVILAQFTKNFFLVNMLSGIASAGICGLFYQSMRKWLQHYVDQHFYRISLSEQPPS
jgi:hypothetical protein